MQKSNKEVHGTLDKFYNRRMTQHLNNNNKKIQHIKKVKEIKLKTQKDNQSDQIDSESMQDILL
jgi:hypothetical protein